ncbi:MAG TPA: hypothetical protein DD473_00825 [Planctomycetaceae bacterium]|nr:hypothetical protein [Planctomycetaceae bacterium]|tara:strand:- start:248 stop:661 length:414 start_codon:yes stop_codon:yes gene_type:complete
MSYLQYRPELNTRSFLLGITLGIILSVIGGCETNTSSNGNESQVVSLPALMVIESVEWTREPEFSEKHQAKLEQYFHEHPSLAENPVISGDPQVYRNPKNATRFYWIEKTENTEPNWCCLELKGGEWTLTDGSGSPF